MSKQDSNGLTKTEENRLGTLEATIERGRKTFMEVGQALYQIREERLYRLTHKSFDVYCEERWGFSRVQAHRLIEAAVVVAEMNVLPMGNGPDNERQARALAEVEPDRRTAVWSEAVSRAPVDEKTGKPKVTASLISEVAEEAEDEPADDPRIEKAQDALIRFDELKRLLRQTKNEITAMRDEGVLAHVTNGLEIGLESIANQIKDAIPFASCPRCAGKGCEPCKGKGWLAKVEYGQLSKRDQSQAVTL